MSERILVCVAWPYANGSVHVGQVAGCYLPADIFARFHRMKGNEVLMVSGSDQHGTPVTIKAEAEGKTPNQIVDFYHQEFLDTWRRFGISFDLFTTTGTPNHTEVAQEVFLKLLEKDYIYKDKVSQAYCEKCQRFLPDRYVEGTCPFCKSTRARGDQCHGQEQERRAHHTENRFDGSHSHRLPRNADHCCTEVALPAGFPAHRAARAGAPADAGSAHNRRETGRSAPRVDPAFIRSLFHRML